MSIPLVTAIVPVYKSSQYIEVFLKQLTSQTIFKEIEVILDLNEPSSFELRTAKKYLAKHPDQIKVIISNPRISIAASMNKCMKNSRGRFIAIWNIDDLRTPESLELQSSFLLKNKSFVAVSGAYKVVNVFKSKQGELVLKKNIPVDSLLKEMHLGPFFMFRKEILHKVGFFDEQFEIAADFDFAIRVARYGKVYFLQQLLGYYLDSGVGASTSPGIKQPIERTVIQMRYGAYLDIEQNLSCLTGNYTVSQMKLGKRLIPIAKFFEDYDIYIQKQMNTYLDRKFRNIKSRLLIFFNFKK
jgi:glycosyltransferase involved in cell wall biosynthesis